MSNSPLVSYTKISPFKTSPRNHKIDTITIHCVVGQFSLETLGNIFSSPSKSAIDLATFKILEYALALSPNLLNANSNICLHS